MGALAPLLAYGQVTPQHGKQALRGWILEKKPAI